jgi:uncharacterized protein YggE
MNMKRSICLFFVCCASVIFAQTGSPLQDKPFIEVTGTSETEITPDEIYITITLKERAENREKLNIDKQEEALKQELRDLGIDLKNITLNSAFADYGRLRANKKDVINSRSYTLKVQSADMVNKVYERLDKIDAFDAFISRLDHSKITDHTKENRIKAIKAAKEKADYLLSAIGKQAGNPLQVMEAENWADNGPYPGNRGMLHKAMSNASSVLFDNAGGDEIAMKKIKIRSSYNIKFEIR